jgi:TolA-binding protein
VTLSLATALQFDGDLAESDKVCSRFLERFKGSTLTPALLFRQAEKLPNPADRARETARHTDEAIRRYAALVEKYPDQPSAQLARHGLGMAYYRKGEVEKAQKALEAIPPADRVGDLAAVSYSLADIYLRQLPARADDAVAAGKMEEKLKGAIEQCEAFLAAAPDSPLVPDALLKLGFCQQRMAKLLAAPEEQRKALAAARAAYGRVRDRHRASPAFAQAMFERAKVLAAQGETAPAMEELKKFATDEGRRKSGAAPMALLHLATIQRSLNRPADAAATLEACRKTHEASLTGERAGWASLLQYHHAAALREAGRLDEARQLFEQVARGPPRRVGRRAAGRAVPEGRRREKARRRQEAARRSEPARRRREADGRRRARPARSGDLPDGPGAGAEGPQAGRGGAGEGALPDARPYDLRRGVGLACDRRAGSRGGEAEPSARTPQEAPRRGREADPAR